MTQKIETPEEYAEARGCNRSPFAPIRVHPSLMHEIEPEVIDGESRRRWRLWDAVNGPICIAASKKPVLIRNTIVEVKPMQMPNFKILDLAYTYGKKPEGDK